MTGKLRILAYCSAGALLLAIAAVMIMLTALNDAPERNGTATVTIDHGMSAGLIAEMLEHDGIIKNARFFRFYSRITGRSDDFKAGVHIVEPGLSAMSVARLLTRIPPHQPDIHVTVIEGLTIAETAQALASQSAIDSVAFVTLANDTAFAATLGVDKASLEGYLYPDTYFIRPETTAEEMIRRMTGQFHRIFSDSLRARAEERGMTVGEVVTLASIIEKEVNIDSERPLVSSVFHRRLERGRPLEANPTIQFALGEKRRVLYEDLDIDSPYNTYIYAGLPPGPIASPGEKSIRAALWPADTKYLYFVSDGNGGHVFSKKIGEHNRAVQQYRKIMRNARRRKK